MSQRMEKGSVGAAVDAGDENPSQRRLSSPFAPVTREVFTQ
ncbi:hypothetical protein [Cystobacter ferrugineus]|nr:hypothetical protein [Cystobacter ferrugineus]